MAKRIYLGYFSGLKVKKYMAKIMAFAGSNATNSINFQFVKYVTTQIEGHDIQLLNLANFPFPMYSADYETENGYSNSLIELKDDIAQSDALIISVNEHNGYFSAYFKNVLDWLSRVERKFMEGKKILLLSTSPSKFGGTSAVAAGEKYFTRSGGEIVATFSLPQFAANFNVEEGILDADLNKAFREALDTFVTAL